jgi:hypothetical protein
MNFLAELFAFLGAHRRVWLRPILILLGVIAAAWLLAGGILEVFLPRNEPDPLPTLSREHYRHDGAFSER